jgi:hypothetical protein
MRTFGSRSYGRLCVAPPPPAQFAFHALGDRCASSLPCYIVADVLSCAPRRLGSLVRAGRRILADAQQGVAREAVATGQAARRHEGGGARFRRHRAGQRRQRRPFVCDAEDGDRAHRQHGQHKLMRACATQCKTSPATQRRHPPSPARPAPPRHAPPRGGPDGRQKTQHKKKPLPRQQPGRGRSARPSASSASEIVSNRQRRAFEYRTSKCTSKCITTHCAPSTISY